MSTNEIGAPSDTMIASRATRRLPWTIRLFLVLVGVGTWLSVGLPAAAQDAPLTDAMRKEFGAANWIPEDAGYFSGSFRLGEQWEAIAESEAFGQLLALPLVQMGLMQVKQHPSFAQIEAARQDNPLIDGAINVLQDAGSQEIFFYLDRRGPGLFKAVGNLYNKFYFKSMISGIRESLGMDQGQAKEELAAQMVADVLDHEEQLQVPGIVIGFRLADPDKGQQLIEAVTPHLRMLIPFIVYEESIGQCELISLRFEARTFLDDPMLGEIESSLEQSGVGIVDIERLVGLLESQTMTVSLGIRGEYLLLSIGADNSHLEQLGSGQSLAECEAMAPVRQNFRSRLVSLSYVDELLTSTGKMDVADLVAQLHDLLAQVGDALPEGLAARAGRDARALLTEFNESLPEAAPHLKSIFLNEGFESFTFSAIYPGSLDTTEPLAILEHAGAAPLLAHASHAPPSRVTYDRFAHWIAVLYGYFEDYVVPQIAEEDLAEFKKFEQLFLPAIKEFHETTSNLLFPSVDGGQGLFVIDGGGRWTTRHGTGEPFPSPIEFPRPAIFFEVNDAERFVAAFSEYRGTINRLLAGAAAQEESFDEVQLPSPESRDFSGGTLYSYTLPAEYDPAPLLADDFEPHAVVTPHYVALSLSPVQTEGMFEANPIPSTETIDLTAPAGRVTWCDVAGFTKLLFDDADTIMGELIREEVIPEFQAGMIRFHAKQVGKSLGALRSYRGRTYEQDNRQVTHSWLHIEDIEK